MIKILNIIQRVKTLVFLLSKASQSLKRPLNSSSSFELYTVFMNMSLPTVVR